MVDSHQAYAHCTFALMITNREIERQQLYEDHQLNRI